MRLTSKTEYALLALTYLARNLSQEPISVEEIAKAQSIPPKFLEQIFQFLRRAKIVRSVKGKHGGYILVKSPEDISLAEIVRLFDGPLAPTESASKNFYCSTPIEKERKLLSLFKEVREILSQKMEQTTLAQMV